MSIIRIFVTGGTFDKEYNELTGALAFKDTHLPEMLRLGRCRVDASVRTLMMIDSLEMTDSDRALVVEECRRAVESRLLITHGTDTMIETGLVLQKNLDNLQFPIVLTGAMIPYEIANSDALFNLGFACGVAQTLPAGVYIAMNGQVFGWDNVQKNRSAGVFQPL